MYKDINPQEQEIFNYYMTIHNMEVCFYTNVKNLPRFFIKKDEIKENKHYPSCNKGNSYKIVAILSEAIKSDFTSDTHIINLREKINPNDSLVSVNKRYSLSDFNILSFIYPNNSIHISSNDFHVNNIVSGNIDVLIFYCKKILKNIATVIFEEDGYTPLHASAISKNGKTDIFIGDSNVGKSATCFNLCSTFGYSYMNDDIVFIKNIDNKWFVESIPIAANIRKSSIKFLNTSIDTDKCYYSSYQDSYIINNMKFSYRKSEINNVYVVVRDTSKNITGGIDKLEAKENVSLSIKAHSLKDGKDYVVSELLSKFTLYYLNIIYGIKECYYVLNKNKVNE